MNQYKKRVFLWVLLLTVCAALLGSCIHPIPGDLYTTAPDTTLSPPEITIPTTPEDTTPEQTAPEATTPHQTTTKEPTTETTPVVTTPQETTTERPTTTQPPVVPPTPVEKIKIYIDQGHNPFLPKQDPLDPNKGWNTGASNEALGLYEQDLTFEIGMLLYDLLAKDDRFEVRLSRPTAETILGTDNDSALDARVNDAAAWGADYFISLHINSYADPSVDGIEVYTATTDGEQYELGKKLLNGLLASTGLDNRGMRDGSKLRVLKNATMPAVLLEMGYISNTNDATLLDNSPELFAQGVFDGIQAYFDALEEEASTIEITAEQ